MSKHTIGISLRITNAANYPEVRDSLSHDWIQFLDKLDLIPILIPNTISNVTEFLQNTNISGVILSGGDNIGDNAFRDKTEIEIINYSISHVKPIIGICRGMQVINSFFGGKINVTDNLEHVNKQHKIELREQDFFGDRKSITVNSYHKNMIDRKSLGKDLIPFANSLIDDTIEGFIHKELPITGVMWHPERNPNDESYRLLQKSFVENLDF